MQDGGRQETYGCDNKYITPGNRQPRGGKLKIAQKADYL
jgi:hypothetical protein